MKATILIPTTGDRGPLLPLSVGSALRQSTGDIEVFLMGDGVSAATRAVAQDLAAADSRVRFFDHPKDDRRGERRRHAVLTEEARGRIVCYLTDRDLLLPDHVAEMDRLLEDADFAHTLRFGIARDDRFSFVHALDIDNTLDRAAARHVETLIPLSFVGHTLDAYRRLPHGWRTTPTGTPTDVHMWRQFLAQPDLRTATSTRPTVLYFKRGNHPGESVAKRLAELERWEALTHDPNWIPSFEASVRDAAIRATADLARGRVDRPLARWLPAVAKLDRSLKTRARAMRRVVREQRKAARRRSAGIHIEGVAEHFIDDGLVIEAYWVGEPHGPGLGASVLAGDDELMRFDAFGGAAGHMHLNMRQARETNAGRARIYFEPGTIRAHMDRAAHELTRNLAYAIKTNGDTRIRLLDPPQDAVETAARWMIAHWQKIVAARSLDIDG